MGQGQSEHLSLSKELSAKMHLEIKLDEVRTVCGRDLGKIKLGIGRRIIGQEGNKDLLE